MKLQIIGPKGSWTKLALLLCIGLGALTTAAAQSNRVTLSSRTIAIEQAFQEIERQTGFVIAVNNSTFDTARRVTLSSTGGTADEVLADLLSNVGYTFEMKGNYIVLRPAPQQRPSAPAAGSEAAQAQVAGMSIPTYTHRQVLTPVEEPVPAPKGNYPVVRNLRETPRWAVKMNMLSVAALSLNLGVETRLAPKTTLELTGSINWWELSDELKWKHSIFQPGVRFWGCEAFNGFFWGIHAHSGIFNVGHLPDPPFSDYMNTHRFQGWLVGGGASIGYHWMVGKNKRWGIEAELGAGYAYLDYKTYLCENCGRQTGSDTKHYFGPTKAAVSLVFIIK